MAISINGLPGYPTSASWTPRRVRRGTQGVTYWEGGVIVDGTYSGDASNTGYVDVLQPGKIMVQKNTGGLFRNFIVGKTNGAVSAGTVTSITVVAAVATEVARLIVATGGNVALAIIGPPSAAGTTATTAITATAASGTTITISSATLPAIVTDSPIVIAAAAYTAGTFCIVDDNDYLKLSDEYGARANVGWARALIGGDIETSQLLDWPADTSTIASLKALLSTVTGASNFRFF